MKNKKLKIANKFVFFTGALFSLFLNFPEFVLSQYCPWDTQPARTSAILVGEVTDDGGDPYLEVWFQWGETQYYGYETPHQSKYGIGIFCDNISGLQPYTTYHYRAVAKNSAGISYGQDKSFTTLPGSPPVVITKGAVLSY